MHPFITPGLSAENDLPDRSTVEKERLMSNLFVKQRTFRSALVSAFALGATVLGVTAYAANTATSNATATVIAPIAIAGTVDLQFGKFVAASTTGTVVMSPAGARSATGGVILSSVSAGAAASYNVTGDTTASYTITLPTSAVTITSGANNMTVGTFTSTPSGTGTLTAGAQTLTVGGTLSVGANQATGAYTGTYNVTVQYN
jgi:hypothetical protein